MEKNRPLEDQKLTIKIGNKPHRYVTLLFPLIVVLISGGCWNHLPIEEAAFISLVGIDADPAGTDAMVITYVIANPNALGGGGGGTTGGDGGGPGPSGTPFYLVSSLESSFESAFATHLQYVPRQSQLTHLAAVVIGEEIARQSVSPAIARVLRQVNIRETIDIVVSSGHAQVLIDARPVLEPLPGDALSDLINRANLTGVSGRIQIYEFARALLAGRKDPIAPYVERIRPILSPAPEDFVQQPVVSSPSISNEVRVSGFAVFKSDKMVGTLLGDEARGAAWAFGHSRGLYSTPHPLRENWTVGMEVLTSRTKTTPTFVDGRLSISFDIDVRATLKETGPLSSDRTGADTYRFEDAFETAIANDIKKTMAKLQSELGADIFGIADMIYRKSPTTWEQIEPLWNEIYADADVHANAKVTLISGGLLR